MSKTRTSPATRVLLVTIAVVLATVAVGVAGTPVAADDELDPAAAYYGEVTIDGEPAPVGTVISAEIDGEERGSVTIEEAGVFGSDDWGDDANLVVPGSADDDGGEAVTFLVNGEPADTDPAPIEWESGTTSEVSLSAEDVGEPPFFDVEIDEDESEPVVEPGENATVVADIENTGDVAGETLVEFEVDEETLETDELELDAGDTETVTYEVALEDEGEFDAFVSTADATDGITLVAEEDVDDPPPAPPAPPDPTPPDISVVDADLETDQVDVSKSIDVFADLENVGEERGNITVDLEVDGDVVDSQTFKVDGGATETVTFTQTFEEAGEFDIAVNGVEAGTLTVVEDDPLPADISVVDASVTPEEVEPGEMVTADGTLENAGEEAGEATVELEVDGEGIADETVELEGGETLDVSFDFTLDEEGTYEVFVDDVLAGTVTVVADDDPVDDPVDDDPADDDDDGIPGFGAVAALIGVLAVATLVARRR